MSAHEGQERMTSTPGNPRRPINPPDARSTCHAMDDDLKFDILGHLSAAEVDAFEHHISHCQECTGRLAATARFVAQIIDSKHDSSRSEQRGGPRSRASDACFLRCFSPLLPNLWPIQIRDVSKNGLGLLVPTSLPPGALVQVHIDDVFVLGESQVFQADQRTPISHQDSTTGSLSERRMTRPPMLHLSSVPEPVEPGIILCWLCGSSSLCITKRICRTVRVSRSFCGQAEPRQSGSQPVQR